MSKMPVELLEAVIESIGVYPAAVVEGGIERKRTEWQEGFNAATAEINDRREIAAKWFEGLNPIQRLQVRDLLADWTIWIRIEESGVEMLVNCNDVFAWGSADCEPIAMNDLPILYNMWAKERRYGGVRWAALRRGMRPQEPVVRRMRDVGAWDAELDDL